MEFLRDKVPELTRMGFDIRVPAWWQEARQNMALRLKIRTPKQAGTSRGMFGMDAVLEYDWQLSLGGETLDP